MRTQALLEAAASGSRVELLRWSVAAEGMDTRRAAAMMNAARGRLADILRGTADRSSRRSTAPGWTRFSRNAPLCSS